MTKAHSPSKPKIVEQLVNPRRRAMKHIARNLGISNKALRKRMKQRRLEQETIKAPAFVHTEPMPKVVTDFTLGILCPYPKGDMRHGL